jgi:hypothetical protein
LYVELTEKIVMKKLILIFSIIIFISCQKEFPATTVTKPKGNPPIAFAGSDSSITIPDEIFVLEGVERSASAYPALTWTAIQSPPLLELNHNEFIHKAYPIFLHAGNYNFQLLAKNSFGEDTDTVSIKVKWAPRCNAERELIAGGSFVATGTVLENISFGTSIAVGNGKLIFAGGTLDEAFWDYDGAGISSLLAIFEPVSGKYSAFKLTVPRFNATISTLGDLVFVAGGYDDGGLSNLVEIFDQSTGKFRVQKLSVARLGITSVAVGHLILFAGGLMGSGNGSDVVDIYDLDTDSWSVTKLSSARSNISVVAANDKIFFGGGYTNTGNVSDVVDVYEPATLSWSAIKLSEPRVFMQSTFFDGKVVFAGGNKNKNVPSTAIDFIDPETLRLTQDCLVKGSFNSFYQTGVVTTSDLTLNDRFYVNDGGHLAYLDQSTHRWKYSIGPGTNYSMFTSGNKIYAFDYLASGTNKYVIYKYEE